MAKGEESAAAAAMQLRDQPEWAERVSHQAGTSVIEIAPGPDLTGALLELRPAFSLEEVPVWVDLEHGRADLSEIEFEPASVTVVRWGRDHRERGLIADFPQMLLGPALAGQRQRTPVAGGRRADGALELWIEPTATGEVLITVDSSRRLGRVAELRWRSGPTAERLLVALPESGATRNLGLARLALDPVLPLQSLSLMVFPDLVAVDGDGELFSRSASAAISEPGQELWRQLLGSHPGEQ